MNRAAKWLLLGAAATVIGGVNAGCGGGGTSVVPIDPTSYSKEDADAALGKINAKLKLVATEAGFANGAAGFVRNADGSVNANAAASASFKVDATGTTINLIATNAGSMIKDFTSVQMDAAKTGADVEANWINTFGTSSYAYIGIPTPAGTLAADYDAGTKAIDWCNTRKFKGFEVNNLSVVAAGANSDTEFMTELSTPNAAGRTGLQILEDAASKAYGKSVTGRAYLEGGTGAPIVVFEDASGLVGAWDYGTYKVTAIKTLKANDEKSNIDFPVDALVNLRSVSLEIVVGGQGFYAGSGDHAMANRGIRLNLPLRDLNAGRASVPRVSAGDLAGGPN